ncbi:MAG TPA: hypothetical protein VJ984_08015 [Xanthomonadales bacterium]|nr:hypothetical protein [Xanthomonadales bacterium]
MDNKENSNWMKTLLNEHPALLVSILYVSASAIGMFFSWDFLRRFGVNVFHYSQLSDFLLVSLKEPITWLLVFAAVSAMLFDNAMSRRYQKKGKLRWMRWYGSNRYRSVNYLVSAGMMVLFLWVFSDRIAEETIQGKGDYVEVQLADDSDPKSAMLLGTTGQFIFLYDPETKVVDIHPNENIQTITIRPSE